MSDLIMGLAGVIQKDIDRLGTVAQNAANANTVGYKSVQEFAALAGVEKGKSADPVAQLGSDTHLRLHDGALRPTGRSSDLAISGNAWFVVDTPQGTRLTRDGRFHVNTDGVLVNVQGFAVVGEGGAIRLARGEFSVASDGAITQNGAGVARLVLVSTPSTSGLVPDGNSLYRTEGAISAARGHSVHQGMLEQSNVNLSADMVRMMETTRHIESVQRALSAYNDVLSTGIDKIGKD
jgi:flagellar basal body rod protein FlgG